MTTWKGSGGIVPLILYLGTRRNWVVAFNPQSPNPLYPLDRRVCDPQGRSRRYKQTNPVHPALSPSLLTDVMYSSNLRLYSVISLCLMFLVQNFVWVAAECSTAFSNYTVRRPKFGQCADPPPPWKECTCPSSETRIAGTGLISQARSLNCPFSAASRMDCPGMGGINWYTTLS
jgi:hypothetical protein